MAVVALLGPRPRPCRRDEIDQLQKALMGARGRDDVGGTIGKPSPPSAGVLLRWGFRTGPVR